MRDTTMTASIPEYIVKRPTAELFTPAENAVPCRVTKKFIRNLQKEAARRGLSAASKHLLVALQRLKADDYNGAVSYAKEHGFDLELLRYQPRSGVLESNWERMMESIKVWGTRPQFVSLEKPLSIVPDVVSTQRLRKYEADTPYRR